MVTGCASGIGAHVVRQLTELGADVVGLDKQPPSGDIAEFHTVDLTDPASIDRAVGSVGAQVDALFNIAGVSSGIGDPLLVLTINFLGLRHATEALLEKMPAGSSIVSVSSLAAKEYREHQQVVGGLLNTATMSEGIDWCHRHPDALADGGYRLSKEAIILYTMSKTAALGCPGYSDQLHRARCHRDADPRPAARRVRPGLSRRHPQAAGPGLRSRGTGRGSGVPE